MERHRAGWNLRWAQFGRSEYPPGLPKHLIDTDTAVTGPVPRAPRGAGRDGVRRPGRFPFGEDSTAP